MKRIVNHDWDITPEKYCVIEDRSGRTTLYIFNIFLPGMKRAARITISEWLHSRRFMDDALWLLHRDFRWEILPKHL